ncbi:piggyBac transposable element-derived protein 4 [Trichonephila inaurata madagascariensis]|uniref:PiggyBac transposable element-derived protein 4 n=1 Tax=Trichonephila inaurata madagascariensis TaxID=2747483 RepID=A0A8X7C2C5_9ARAC|nr:piggyBac transposable element-derived protein 4 [Trichonephila inaurata madagascariensis]
MSKRRILSEKEIEYYTNLSDSEWSDISVGESNDCIPGSESDESISNNTADELEHNDDDEHDDGAVQNNNIMTGLTDIQNDPLNVGFNQNPGLKFDDIAIEKLVTLFFSEDFLNFLVDQTNLYASQEINKQRPLRKVSRLSTWTDTNVPEMKVFLGLLLKMGPCNLPTIQHYWNTSEFYNFPFWRSFMSRNRFQLILRLLHFADNTVETNYRLY